MLVEKNENEDLQEITLIMKKSSIKKLEFLTSIDEEIMDVMINNLYEKFKRE